MSKSKPRIHITLTRQLSWQVRLLSIQFLLGMAVNLIGLPSETHGFTNIVTSVFLGIHVLVALGLFINSLILVRLAWSYGQKAQRLAIYGVTSIVIAMISGILTLIAPFGNVWSYLMAVAFLAVFGFYGNLLPVIRRAKKQQVS